MKGKQLSKRLLIFAISAVLLLSLLLPITSCGKESTPTAQPTTLVFTTHEAPGTFWQTEVFDPWFAEIEKRTDGQIKIEVHWNAELFSPMDAYDAAARGAVDIAEVFQMMVPGKFPMDEINNFYPYDSAQWSQSQVYWELYEKYPQMQAQYSDTKLISLGVFLGRGIGTTKVPIYTLEDLQGLKLIATGVWSGKIIEQLGSVPISVPPADIYSSIQNGTVDGSTCPIFLLEMMGLGDLFNYFAKVNTYGVPLCVVMSNDAWDKLSPDAQKVFNELGGSYFAKIVDNALKKLEQNILASIADSYPNLTVIEIPEEESARWAAVYSDVLDEFAADLDSKGLPGQEFTDDFLKIEKKYAD